MAKGEIHRRFPEYASLIKPAPATVDDIRARLRPDEALLSFYFGFRGSFVWAVPKAGPIEFAPLTITAVATREEGDRTARALDPDVFESIADIPPFDVAARMSCTSCCWSRSNRPGVLPRP